MRNWVIIKKDDLQVVGFYSAEEKDDSPTFRSLDLSEPISVHIELPEGLDINEIKVELINENYVVSKDLEKVEARLAFKWAAFRRQRNIKLQECDYTQLSDVPYTVEQKAVWAVYRQALRDLPDNTGDPSNPIWPIKPE